VPSGDAKKGERRRIEEEEEEEGSEDTKQNKKRMNKRRASEESSIASRIFRCNNFLAHSIRFCSYFIHLVQDISACL
jgi:hypothetical protein